MNVPSHYVKFEEAGQQLIDAAWGRKSESVVDLIESMDAGERSLCVQIAMAQELRRTRALMAAAIIRPMREELLMAGKDRVFAYMRGMEDEYGTMPQELHDWVWFALCRKLTSQVNRNLCDGTREFWVHCQPPERGHTMRKVWDRWKRRGRDRKKRESAKG